MTKKQTKTQRIAELERKLRESNAAQVHNYHFADQGLAKASAQNFMGSGIVITLTALGGREVIPATLLLDGLSAELIAALRQEIQRSYKRATLLKPSGLEAA